MMPFPTLLIKPLGTCPAPSMHRCSDRSPLSHPDFSSTRRCFGFPIQHFLREDPSHREGSRHRGSQCRSGGDRHHTGRDPVFRRRGQIGGTAPGCARSGQSVMAIPGESTRRRSGLHRAVYIARIRPDLQEGRHELRGPVRELPAGLRPFVRRDGLMLVEPRSPAPEDAGDPGAQGEGVRPGFHGSEGDSDRGKTAGSRKGFRRRARRVHRPLPQRQQAFG